MPVIGSVDLFAVGVISLLLSLGLLRCTASGDADLETAVLPPSRGYGIGEAWAAFMFSRFPVEALPLFLTVHIQAGQIAEARTWSRVHMLGKDDVESYSGYLTVNKTYGSNMFFWFFPAEKDAASAPLLLWLNGGPGRSSVVGALMENGPYEITNQTRLKRRQTPWTRYFSMLYVDNPVGTGYSFTENSAGYSRDMDQVSENMYSVLRQFFQLFPEYQKNDLYIGGQSYAGKYIPSLGRWIHDQNVARVQPAINLKGMYLGAGFCDPVNMLPVFPDYLYYAGLVSDAYRTDLKDRINRHLNDTLHGNLKPSTWDNLNLAFSSPADKIGLQTADHLEGMTATNTHLFRHLDKFMNLTMTRLKLHVAFAKTDRQLTWSEQPANSLAEEFLVGTSHHNAFLMDHYKVLHYSGNMDIIVNVPMTEAFLANVQWSGRQEYSQSDRAQWFVGSSLAGWFVKIGNFTRVIVRNSGHMTPYDQPEATLDMMRRFVFDVDFSLHD